MKKLKSLILILFLIAPLISFSQEAEKKEKAGSVRTYQRKTYKKTTTVGTSSTDTIRKENAPILEDNGSVNTTGIVDGSRSSTGRPDADTMVNYSVKRKKTTISTGGKALPDSIKRKTKQP